MKIKVGNIEVSTYNNEQVEIQELPAFGEQRGARLWFPHWAEVEALGQAILAVAAEARRNTPGKRGER